MEHRELWKNRCVNGGSESIIKTIVSNSAIRTGVVEIRTRESSVCLASLFSLA